MTTNREVTPRECAQSVLETVPCVMQALRTQMRRSRGADLSVPQFRSLAFVGRRPNASLSDVAQHVGTSLPSMSKLIDGLVGRGLVDRAVPTGDRRRLALSLTPQGSTLLALVRGQTQSFLAELFMRSSAIERAAVVDVMALLTNVVSATRPTEETS